MTLLLKFREERLLEGEYIIFQPDVSEEVFWEYVDEDSNCELIDGVLIIHSPPSEEHEDIFGYLYTLLRFYLEKTKSGKIYGSRFVMRLSSRWNPEPDIIIIRPENYSKIKSNYYEGAADLVIEILSKSTRELDVTKKLPAFLKAGVTEVWLIDPEKKEIVIISQDNQTTYRDHTSEEVIKSSVLPGLQFQVNWLWARDKFPMNYVLTKI
ncbi:MAG: Uma2 family endonuclease [Candidatus Helarchaeota archaeon]